MFAEDFIKALSSTRTHPMLQSVSQSEWRGCAHNRTCHIVHDILSRLSYLQGHGKLPRKASCSRYKQLLGPWRAGNRVSVLVFLVQYHRWSSISAWWSLEACTGIIGKSLPIPHPKTTIEVHLTTFIFPPRHLSASLPGSRSPFKTGARRKNVQLFIFLSHPFSFDCAMPSDLYPYIHRLTNHSPVYIHPPSSSRQGENGCPTVSRANLLASPLSW